MSEWTTIRLGSVVRTNTTSYSPKEGWKYVNYLDTGNITENVIDSIHHIDLENEKLPSRAKRKVQMNSILYSTVRPNQKHFGIIKSMPKNFLVSTGFAVIDVISEKADADYLYFWLTQNTVVEQLHAIAEQSVSAYPSIKASDIENLEIALPPLTVQKSIASILKSISDKMSHNSNINENLEQQAKALYQQMFIENTSPDWIEGSLRDIADITMGQSPSGSSYNEDGIGAIFFQGRAEFSFRFPTIHLYTTEPKRMACANDILMSVRAPVGDLNIAHTDCCIGRGLAAIHSKTNHQSFVLYTMFSLRKQLDVFNGEGTVFGSINRSSLNDMPILIPSDETIEEFERIVAPMDAAIRNNYDEICRLQAIRDTLLPRLMSGELDVSSIDL